MNICILCVCERACVCVCVRVVFFCVAEEEWDL